MDIVTKSFDLSILLKTGVSFYIKKKSLTFLFYNKRKVEAVTLMFFVKKT